MAKVKQASTFVVRFVGRGVSPGMIPLRAVSTALSAIQDLASGRDPWETAQVPPEKGIGLVDVQTGSAVYSCVAHAPSEARANLRRVGDMLNDAERALVDGDQLIAALRPLESLSDVARSIGCRLEVKLAGKNERALFTVTEDVYKSLSSRMLLEGDTTIVGRVERVGGATGMRCLLRVPGRKKILYCDVGSKELVRQLGQHLYENISATGRATWLHRTWRIYKFSIRDFKQPKMTDADALISELRDAGLNAWDGVENPLKLMREWRSE